MQAGGYLRFPQGFVWGAASSSYQIEGAWNEDGRGLSIWDTFCRQPGRVWHGDSGDIAVDHYHRYADDVQIMADLGLKAYRFSVAWPRILPEGTGRVNPKGLDFYDRLVDALLARGIEPYLTLYHWDLPQALQERGGWPNRDTAQHFADYARIVARHLGDRVSHWITHNEPFVAAVVGHLLGEHAPGLQDPTAAFAAGHHLLLSHGYACEVLRQELDHPTIGIALNLSPVYPASDSEQDRAAAARYDLVLNRIFLEPILLGRYPAEAQELVGAFFPKIESDDLQRMSVPLDFVGVNYYSRVVVCHDPGTLIIAAAQVHPEGRDYSGMWEIYPEGIYDLLMRIQRDYQPRNLMVTENGICVPDGLDFDGRVRDLRRIQYLRDHLTQVHRAIQDGVPVRGYFVWSLTDNFEWAYGFNKRFGIVYVDLETQKRTLKDSGRWFAQAIAENAVR